MIIKFVKVGQALFVGQADEVDATCLLRPRLVFSDQKTQSINLAPCIGSPSSIVIHAKPDYTYYNEDPDFAKFYVDNINAIKGLEIVK